MNEIAQAFLSHYFAMDYPYNSKIDNFAEMEDVDNIIVCSLRDEEIIKEVRPVGVLQFYNRIASDVLQDDIQRVFYVRKLVGAMAVKCELM